YTLVSQGHRFIARGMGFFSCGKGVAPTGPGVFSSGKGIITDISCIPVRGTGLRQETHPESSLLRIPHHPASRTRYRNVGGWHDIACRTEYHTAVYNVQATFGIFSSDSDLSHCL